LTCQCVHRSSRIPLADQESTTKKSVSLPRDRAGAWPVSLHSPDAATNTAKTIADGTSINRNDSHQPTVGVPWSSGGCLSKPLIIPGYWQIKTARQATLYGLAQSPSQHDVRRTATGALPRGTTPSTTRHRHARGFRLVRPVHHRRNGEQLASPGEPIERVVGLHQHFRLSNMPVI
jgi:hypothetical protein